MSKYDKVFSRSSPFIEYDCILFKGVFSLLLLFQEWLHSLFLLLCNVVCKTFSVRLEKGSKYLERHAQYQIVSSSFRRF